MRQSVFCFKRLLVTPGVGFSLPDCSGPISSISCSTREVGALQEGHFYVAFAVRTASKIIPAQNASYPLFF
jgi:hypothetical protein